MEPDENIAKALTDTLSELLSATQRLDVRLASVERVMKLQQQIIDKLTTSLVSQQAVIDRLAGIPERRPDQIN